MVVRRVSHSVFGTFPHKPPISFFEPYTIGEPPHKLKFVRGAARRMEHTVEAKHRGPYSELLASAWLLEKGFEVFRNASDRGPVDLIALKDGAVTFIDVKTAQITIDKFDVLRVHAPRLSKEQEKLGVRALLVTPDGVCDWDARHLTDIYNEMRR